MGALIEPTAPRLPFSQGFAAAPRRAVRIGDEGDRPALSSRTSVGWRRWRSSTQMGHSLCDGAHPRLGPVALETSAAAGAARKRPPGDRRRRLVQDRRHAKGPRGWLPFIFDRKKELIIRGGYEVLPARDRGDPVRAPLYEHLAVREHAVVEVPPPQIAEDVGAAVALKAGAVMTEAEIRDHFTANVAAYQYPYTTADSSISCRTDRQARSSSANSSCRRSAPRRR